MTTRRQLLVASLPLFLFGRARALNAGTPVTKFLRPLNGWIDARNSAGPGVITEQEREHWAITTKAWRSFRSWVNKFYEGR